MKSRRSSTGKKVSRKLVSVKLPVASIIPPSKDATQLVHMAQKAGLSTLDIAAAHKAWLGGFTALQKAIAVEKTEQAVADTPAVSTYMLALAKSIEADDGLDDTPQPDIDALEAAAVAEVGHGACWLDTTHLDDADEGWTPKPATREFQQEWVAANDPPARHRARQEAMTAFLAEFYRRVTKAGNPSQQRKQFAMRMLAAATSLRLNHAGTCAVPDTDESASAALDQAPAATDAPSELPMAAEGAMAATTVAVAVDRIEHLDPRGLIIPSLHEEVFGSRAQSEMLKLQESISAVGVRRPPTVTGQGCASAPGTVLEGACRTRCAIAAGCPSIPVRVLDGLTKEQEDDLLLRSNVLDEHGRTLNERQRWEVERRLITLHGKTQGQRTDIGQTSLDAQGGDRHDRETPALIAREVGATPTAVADRMKAFGSVVSTARLKDALAAGTIKRAAAAKEVRAVEQAHGINSEPSRDPDALQAARAAVDSWVAARLDGKGEKSAVTGAPKLQQIICFAVDATTKVALWEGTLPTRKIEIALEDGHVLLRWHGAAVAKSDTSSAADPVTGGGETA